MSCADTTTATVAMAGIAILGALNVCGGLLLHRGFRRLRTDRQRAQQRLRDLEQMHEWLSTGNAPQQPVDAER